MEWVKREEAVEHVHEDGCTVYEYPMKNREMSIGVARIERRYPERGYALNHRCTEMGYVLKGAGKLVTETQEVALGEGDVVYIPPGEKYYWEGKMTIVLPTNPAWSPEQHEATLASDLGSHFVQ
jgi:mannose-6-phosphate isomerase-like protein (cupin superfamily)